MRIEILAVGSELLTPSFSDTNSLELTRRLNDIGLDVTRKTIVGDDGGDIAAAVREAASRSDLLIVMGGLGPTEDDKTREACAEALGRPLAYRPEILEGIRQRFLRRGFLKPGRDLPPSNAKQAFVLEGAEVLPNPNGTAPGQWLTAGRFSIALLPGPPKELLPMFEAEILPRLRPKALGATGRRVLKLTGLGESDAETRIADLYPPPGPLRLTILSAPGKIELHAAEFSTAAGAADFPALETLVRALKERLGEFVYSDDGADLETVVGRLLKARGLTLACAESCTGGLLSGRITGVPGSSAYFKAGYVSYENEAKTRDLGVSAELIAAHGAVSAEVASAMASGARLAAGADVALAVTGIAGPGGGTPEKPVGLVFIALADSGGAEPHRHIFFGGREQIRFQAGQRALDLLRRRLSRSAGT